MTMKKLPDIKWLMEHFEYNPETGFLIRRKSRSPNAMIGAIAGTLSRSGYVILNIEGSLFRVHRIAWFMHYGFEPPGFIDHINGNRSDNRICNLRIATKSKNNFNSKIRSDNTSMCKGVHYYKSRQKWSVYINSNRKRFHIGYFDKYEDAVSARRAAAARVHGDFARLDI